ncbi:MAG: hypothetical protein AAFP28_03130 [Pseudomonadota bacterium]
MFRAAILAAALTAGPLSAQSLDVLPLGIDVGNDAQIVQAVVTSDAAQPNILGLTPLVPAAVVTQAALPQPSLILGFIEIGQEAAFGIETLLSTTVEQVAFAPDDLAAREALRTSDPELFRQLVEEGHVDPAADDVVLTLQRELRRMNCYTGAIDNDWGPGSRRAVPAYFARLPDQSWSGDAATVDLFRAIVLSGDVSCPVTQSGSGGTNTGGDRGNGGTTTGNQGNVGGGTQPGSAQVEEDEPRIICTTGCFR